MDAETDSVSFLWDANWRRQALQHSKLVDESHKRTMSLPACCFFSIKLQLVTAAAVSAYVVPQSMLGFYPIEASHHDACAFVGLNIPTSKELWTFWSVGWFATRSIRFGLPFVLCCPTSWCSMWMADFVDYTPSGWWWKVVSFLCNWKPLDYVLFMEKWKSRLWWTVNCLSDIMRMEDSVLQNALCSLPEA